MNLLELNLFRGSIFKQLKFLLSSPQKAQTAFYISEAGTVSKEVIPMHTGFMCPPEIKKAWVVIHSRKYKVYKNGVPLQEESALSISDRSYIPLNPLEPPRAELEETAEDGEDTSPLKNIARLRHADARLEAGTKQDERNDTPHLVIYVSGTLIGIMLIGMFFANTCGG